MKPFVFNKDSWHYSLATEFGGFSKYRTDSNICEYTRAVGKGMLLAGVALAVMLFITYWITTTLVWWAVVLQYGFFSEPGPIVLSLIVGVVGLAMLLGEGVPWVIRKMRDASKDGKKQGYREPVKTDNFVTHAWRSWKEKTCVRVTIIGDSEDD